MLALAALFEKLEDGEIDKIIIFCNPVVTRGAAKLGFYPGDKNDKLLDSQIGNFLIGKLGSITEVEKMLDEETLLLVPVGDCRGMDTNGKRAGCYITEAQNTTADMMKLILQRVGEDCIMILDGDDLCQVDLKDYSGNNNGLRRTSQAFRGEDIYAEVTLKNIYRSRIAQIAERM
jgi:predicted ribonuclease YlaK